MSRPSGRAPRPDAGMAHRRQRLCSRRQGRPVAGEPGRRRLPRCAATSRPSLRHPGAFSSTATRGRRKPACRAGRWSSWHGGSRPSNGRARRDRSGPRQPALALRSAPRGAAIPRAAACDGRPSASRFGAARWRVAGRLDPVAGARRPRNRAAPPRPCRSQSDGSADPEGRAGRPAVAADRPLVLDGQQLCRPPAGRGAGRGGRIQGDGGAAPSVGLRRPASARPPRRRDGLDLADARRAPDRPPADREGGHRHDGLARSRPDQCRPRPRPGDRRLRRREL